VEDQRLELDVLIDSVGLTIKKLERALSGDRSAPPLSAFDLRSVDVLYGPACDMGEVLRASVAVVGPVVLPRLRQREQELRQSRKALEKIWATNRFVKADRVVSSPRSWLRRELVAELVECEKGAVAVDAAAGAAPAEGAQGGAAADERGAQARPALTTTVVVQEANAQLMFEMLDFMLGWEVEDGDGTDGGAQAAAVATLVRKVHALLCGRGRGGSLFVDEFLYQFVRLVSALSERIGYILSHDYDGVAVAKVVDAVYAVLDGSLSMVGWEEVCRDVYGEGRRWEVLLVDLPVLLRRFVAQAMKLGRREVAMELLKLALQQGNGGGGGGGGGAGAHGDGYKGQAMSIVLGPGPDDVAVGHLIHVSIGAVAEASTEDPRKPDELGLAVTYGIERKTPPVEWVPLAWSEAGSSDAEGDGVAKFAAYLERVRVRSQKRGQKRGRQERSDDGVRVSGLDVRVHLSSGRRSYVKDTEDVFARKRRRPSVGDPSATKAAVRFRNWLDKSGATAAAATGAAAAAASADVTAGTAEAGPSPAPPPVAAVK
jgi:hypothetical protein